MVASTSSTKLLVDLHRALSTAKKLKWQIVPAINSNAALVEVSEKMTGYCIAVPWSIHPPTILTSDIFPSPSRAVQACPACTASHDVEVMAKLSLQETRMIHLDMRSIGIHSNDRALQTPPCMGKHHHWRHLTSPPVARGPWLDKKSMAAAKVLFCPVPVVPPGMTECCPRTLALPKPILVIFLRARGHPTVSEIICVDRLAVGLGC
jgi:hypothetical protein